MASSESVPPVERSSIESLELEIRNLERRLRRGEEVIRDARAAGEDRERVEYLERKWLELLIEYEARADRLSQLR
jgi:hypothetical protein